jgi:hypothetical protein
MALDFSHRHAAGVQREDFVVKACPAGLVLGDDLGLKAGVAVARDLSVRSLRSFICNSIGVQQFPAN